MVANRTPPLSTQIQPLSARSATPCRLAHSPLAKPTVRDRVKEDANPNPPLADVARAWPSCIRVQPLRPSIIITWGLLQHNNVTNCRLINRCQTSSTIVWEELVQYIMLGWFSKALLNLDWRHIERHNEHEAIYHPRIAVQIHYIFFYPVCTRKEKKRNLLRSRAVRDINKGQASAWTSWLDENGPNFSHTVPFRFLHFSIRFCICEIPFSYLRK
jgi:hypothetical protein